MTLRRTLIDGAAAFGLGLTDEQADACMVYLVELEKWYRKFNLTAIRDEREIIIKHFIDSFSYLRGFNPGPGMALLDMGSGAGFPALPIKIAAPALLVIMVESVRKKGTFLRHIIRTLRLEGVEVLDARTGELLPEHQARYNVVTARAFADMGTALKEGSLFLKPGGLMILSRGPAETVSDDTVAEQGMLVKARHEIILPGSGDPRALWVFQKKD
ncbi:MAG: 16S rRNA (guanine(527)-N(7))-methyltransferase RsmG [Nitrospirae bacterium]|nr:16S rRNA (guanine(527)-N(7))-methyltransferase RsmG [Nitrospirota bacterium]